MARPRGFDPDVALARGMDAFWAKGYDGTTMDDLVAGPEAYSIEDVPWTMYFQGNYALHGAFWHNAFGEKRSHGCINVTPEDAKWIFGWTTPYVSPLQTEMRMSLPDHGTIVITREITL